MNETTAELTIVIPTCDRQESVCRLVRELKTCRPAATAIIVIDSSREPNDCLAEDDDVRYVRSSHSNQPYQRYVGALAAGTPLIVYLDDDLFVEDLAFLGYVERAFLERNVPGVGVGIDYIGAIDPVVGRPRGGFAASLVAWWAESRGQQKPGRINVVGNSGGKPEEDGPVQHLWGPMMAFRREVVLRAFDEGLLALYEVQLGKGEDKIISMRVWGAGGLWWVARCCLRHPPDQGSHYTASPRRFLTKVLVSRLYLAWVYCEVFGRSRAYAWWSFGVLLLQTLASGMLREQAAPGTVTGAIRDTLRIVVTTGLKPERLAPGVNFRTDAVRDIMKAGFEVER